MKVLIKRIATILLGLAMVFNFAGCYRQRVDDKQTEYHEDVEAIEKYVLEEYEDYIFFSEPMEAHENIYSWWINFRQQYIYDEEYSSDYTEIELIEGVRARINQFCEENKDYSFLQNKITLVFRSTNQSGSVCTSYGRAYNDIGATGDHTIGFYFVDYELSADKIATCSDIKGIVLTEYSLSDVRMILDSVDGIEYCNVAEEVEKNLQDKYPDIYFY